MFPPRPPLPAGVKADRLALARWLVDPSHPLVARVAVNRLWQAFFGTGIVRTAEDFGEPGEVPSHPELLDWLAVEFARPEASATTPWDVKALVRRFVTSATYRQRPRRHPPPSRAIPKIAFSRGPRYRLPAEVVRDRRSPSPACSMEKSAAKASRPTNRRDCGKNSCRVRTAQIGRRRNMFKATAKTCIDARCTHSGNAPVPRRRSPRSMPPTARPVPSAALATNTPLQALVLWNDPTYVEAARKLAERLMNAAGPASNKRIAYAFRLATTRASEPGRGRRVEPGLRSRPRQIPP